MRASLCLLLLLGCKPKPPPAPQVEPGGPSGPQAVQRPSVPVGMFSQSGVSMPIPAGWRAEAGLPGEDLLVEARHTDTGVVVRLRPGRQGGPDTSRCDFVDEGAAYRTLPDVGIVGSASCPVAGGLRQIWWSDGVRVEVVLPTNHQFDGRELVAPMLRSIRVE